MKLNKLEEMLNHKELVYLWLTEKKISFHDIAQVYVESLERDRRRKQNLIAGLATPLITYLQEGKAPKKQEKFLKGKSAFYLLKSMMFHSAPVEKDLEKMVKDNGYLDRGEAEIEF